MYQGRKKEKPCICVLGVSILHLFLMVSYKNLELMGCCGKLHSLRGEYGYFKEMCFIQILLCPYKVRNSYNDKIRSINNDNNATIFKIVDAIFPDIL
jgi:hypothetical protein